MNDVYPPSVEMTPTGWLTCKSLTDILMAYIDNELPSPVRAEVDRHLSVCPSCVSYVASYRETVRLARLAQARPPHAPPEGLPDDLRRALLAAMRSTS